MVYLLIIKYGIIKHSNTPMNPHETKEICDKLLANDMIYGCGLPFKLVLKDVACYVQICGYI